MKRQHESQSSEDFKLPPNYFFAIILSWFLPGAGHVLLGYRVRGFLIGGALLGTFWLGESVLAHNMAVSRQVHPIFFCLQMGNGGSALVANKLWGEPKGEEANTSFIDRDLPPRLNLGILFCTVSGLLNVLVVLHILDPRTWKEAEDERDHEGSALAGPENRPRAGRGNGDLEEDHDGEDDPSGAGDRAGGQAKTRP